MAALTQTDLDALRSYAIEHGPTWKDALSLDWYHARVEGLRGQILHGLRNNFGPSWLCDFTFANPIAWPNLGRMRANELRAMNIALHLHPWNNTEDENIRMWAAKREIRRRASR